MNNTILTHSIRFLFLALLQVLVFKQMTLGWGNFNYIHVFIYPAFILLLPIRTPDTLLIFLGFLIGITVDLFYDSPGVHASAMVFMAFMRSRVLKFLTPRGGYNINHSPNLDKLGLTWFLLFSGILLFCHILFYFIIYVFTHVNWLEITLRTITSFIVSYIIILLYVIIFNPRG